MAEDSIQSRLELTTRFAHRLHPGKLGCFNNVGKLGKRFSAHVGELEDTLKLESVSSSCRYQETSLPAIFVRSYTGIWDR